MARELSPEAILLDLSMPTMPGEEVLTTLQTDRRTATIPVAIITSSKSISDHDLWSHPNVRTIIDKRELTSDQLQTLLDDMTGRSRTAACAAPPSDARPSPHI